MKCTCSARLAGILNQAVVFGHMPVATLAARLGTDPHRVRDWLAGAETPSLGMVFAMLDALERPDLKYPAAELIVEGPGD